MNNNKFWYSEGALDLVNSFNSYSEMMLLRGLSISSPEYAYENFLMGFLGINGVIERLGGVTLETPAPITFDEYKEEFYPYLKWNTYKYKIKLAFLIKKWGYYELDYSVSYGHGDSGYSKVYLNHPTKKLSYRTELNGYGNLSDEMDKIKLHIAAYEEIFENTM